MPRRATPRFTASKVFTIISGAVNDWVSNSNQESALHKRVLAYLNENVEKAVDHLIGVEMLGTGYGYGRNGISKTATEIWCEERAKEAAAAWCKAQGAKKYEVPMAVLDRVANNLQGMVEREIVKKLNEYATDYAQAKAKELWETNKGGLDDLFDREDSGGNV